MNEEPATERRFLGLVEVDSGTLVLGDPASCLPHAERGKPVDIIRPGMDPRLREAGR